MTTRTVATHIVDALAAAGVERIYGVVGDSLNSLSEAVRQHSGIRWIGVRHEETGYLVEDRDVAGFAQRIAQLLADDALATRMSTAALEWSRRFDWDRAATEMAESLEEAQCAR